VGHSLPLSQQNDDLRKVYVEITTDCNLDCGMCMRHVWQQPERSMAPDTFQELVRQMRAAPSVSVVSFGGFGEPTVHAQFLDFLRQVKEAGLRAELVTNGTLLRGEAAERLLDLELDRLTVSLDGASPGEDRVLHHAPASLVQANLRDFHQLRQLRRVPWPEVNVQFVATRKNIHELPLLAARSRELGVSRIVVSNLVPHTPDLCEQVLYRRWATSRKNAGGTPGNPTISLPPLDIQSEATPVLEQLHAQGRRLQIGDADIAGGEMRCRFVAEGCAAVGPDGSVSPCLPLMHSHSVYFQGQRRQIWEHRTGNIRQATLAQLWESAEYRRFRQKVRRFDFSPCINCGGCDLRESNREDCSGNEFPCCGACLWATGLIQCP
jgi:MoaA/NifB/PqqE/SkfB family radical SAM enzyme